MNNKKKKKRTRLTLREKFRRSKFRQKISELITWIESTIQLDRKRAKLLVFMIFLAFVFVFDLVWLVVPNVSKDIEHPPEYTKAEIPSLVATHQLEIEQNPRDFQAHYELGKIFLFIKEPEKAKVEFFQAIEYAPKGNFKAHFSLANMYLYYREPELSAKVLSEIDDNQLSDELFLKKADVLFALSKLFYSQNKLTGSYEMLQDAYNDYERLGEKDKLELAKKDLYMLLLDMADEAYYVEKNPTKAMIYIENSQKLEENAWAYAKLGYLFFENPKISADYFEKAYTFNPAAVNLEVFTPMLVEAIDISGRENRMADRSYYKGVLARVRQENLTSKVHVKLIPNNVKGFYEKQEGVDEYLPVAYVDIYNGFDKKYIHYLKVRAVFTDVNDKIVGHHDVIAINSDKPLAPQKSKINVRLESNRIISGKQRQDNIYKVILYFSRTRPDEWSYATTKMLQ